KTSGRSRSRTITAASLGGPRRLVPEERDHAGDVALTVAKRRRARPQQRIALTPGQTDQETAVGDGLAGERATDRRLRWLERAAGLGIANSVGGHWPLQRTP